MVCLLCGVLGCERDDDLGDGTPSVTASGHLTLERLSPGLRARFTLRRAIDDLGPESHRLLRTGDALEARGDYDGWVARLQALMLERFDSEAGLTEFLDGVGEPAFEYGMYPGETAREGMAVVPLVRGGLVPGYVFYAFGEESGEAFVDYVSREVLDRRFRLPASAQDPDLAGYAWALAGPKVLLDYWLLGEVDEAGAAFMLAADSLAAAGALRSRTCDGTVTRTCNNGVSMHFRPVASLCDSPDCMVVEAVAVEWTFCNDVCIGDYDGPYIPGGLTGDWGETPQDRDPSGTTNICPGDGGRPDDRIGSFGNPELGGGADRDPGEVEAELNAAIERNRRITAKFDGAEGRVGGRLAGDMNVGRRMMVDAKYAETVERYLDEYGGSVNCEGTQVEDVIYEAAHEALWQGGCQQAARVKIEAALGRRGEWIDLQDLNQFDVSGIGLGDLYVQSGACSLEEDDIDDLPQGWILCSSFDFERFGDDKQVACVQGLRFGVNANPSPEYCLCVTAPRRLRNGDRLSAGNAADCATTIFNATAKATDIMYRIRFKNAPIIWPTYWSMFRKLYPNKVEGAKCGYSNIAECHNYKGDRPPANLRSSYALLLHS